MPATIVVVFYLNFQLNCQLNIESPNPIFVLVLLSFLYVVAMCCNAAVAPCAVHFSGGGAVLRIWPLQLRWRFHTQLGGRPEAVESCASPPCEWSLHLSFHYKHLHVICMSCVLHIMCISSAPLRSPRWVAHAFMSLSMPCCIVASVRMSRDPMVECSAI